MSRSTIGNQTNPIMKTTIKILIIPVLCLALSTGKASAGDEAIAAIGGFVGGVIASNVYNNHKSHRNSHSSYSSNHCAPPSYQHGHKQHRCDRNCSHHRVEPRGYYKTVHVKEWVPGCWRVRYDRCGSRIKYWEPGYYTHVEKRIWVSTGTDRNRHSQYASRGRH